MDYDSSTLIQLKTMCKDRGLRISGSKTEVVIRLMEDDESKSPQPISIGQSNPQQNTTQIIHITNNSKSFPALFGLGIIIYGLFRAYVGVLFISEQYVDFFESFIAILLGFGYITCGLVTMQGYRYGLYGTVGVLAVSGMFSVIYHSEFSPLSIGMGDIVPIEWTLCCSGSCILIVCIPLIVAPNEFSEDRPPILNSLLGAADIIAPETSLVINSLSTKPKAEPKTATEKIVISCTHCDKSLKVPMNFSGNVRCPMCQERFKVQ